MIFLEKMVIIPVDLLWPGVLSGPNEQETTRVKVQTNLFEDRGGEKSPKHKKLRTTTTARVAGGWLTNGHHYGRNKVNTDDQRR